MSRSMLYIIVARSHHVTLTVKPSQNRLVMNKQVQFQLTNSHDFAFIMKPAENIIHSEQGVSAP